ncbi:hypothetical protein [Sphingopyxis granuli]|uniref:restriction endonuclease subunit S n=1 Tax=Sphingopyxis granuli TaxID=267128 RepID=UPI00301E179B
MNIEPLPSYDSYRDSKVEWLGDIPNSWQTKRLKFVVRILKRIIGREGPDVLSITQQGIKIKDVESGEGQLAMNYSKYQIVRTGDFAMNHMDLITGYVDISGYEGVTSPDYRVFAKVSPDVRDGYLLLLLQSGYRSKVFFRYGQGVSFLGRWRFPAESFNNFAIPIPSLAEQDSIVHYVRDKATKIDEAVAMEKRQIALLKELKQIVIQNAVTKGLNPGAPMKDSGVDWIGEIPAHWTQLAQKHIFRLTKSTVGKRSSEYDLLSLTLRGIVKRDMENPEGKFPAEFDTYQEVMPGDFVFCHFDVEETPRTVGLSEHAGMITGAYTVYAPSAEHDPRYLLHFHIFADTDKKLRSLYKGLRNTISKDVFGAFKMPIPPKDEQRAIVEHIDRESRKIDDAIELKKSQIAALTEYKSSLINSAVTGKIKVA